MGFFSKPEIKLKDITFNLGVSDGNTVAKIRNFPIELVKESALEITSDWLKAAVRAKKVVNGVQDTLIDPIIEVIKK